MTATASKTMLHGSAKPDSGGEHSLLLDVKGMHCGGCIAKVERAINAMPDVLAARANLSQGSLRIRLKTADTSDSRFVEALRALGFEASRSVQTPQSGEAAADERYLLRCMGVAGFAAANVMLLSLSVWAGNAEGMSAETRTMFHWFSALIALPALAYAGRPFFASAWRALRVGRTNMDVPISLAVVLASAMSLWETANGGRHAYFDSAITLLFFLLVGRFLDRRARRQVHSAAARLMALQDSEASRITEDGTLENIPAAALMPGDVIAVATGERILADGVVKTGISDIDESLLTGEAAPRTAGSGETVFAGTINLSAPLTVAVSAAGTSTVLAEIVRLTDAAEQRKSAYVIFADRVSRLYAPVVHLLAAGAFAGWTLLGGLAWQEALMIAVAVLIITCPCALGLAVPVVQIVATGRLFKAGILVKSGDALERLAAIDTVVFDKTGTLTLAQPVLANRADLPDDALAAAAALAATSHHPLSRALVAAAPAVPPAANVSEVAGQGLRVDTNAVTSDREIRLGKADWCDVEEMAENQDPSVTTLWLSRPRQVPVRFDFLNAIRPDASKVIEALHRNSLHVSLLSGDRPDVVAATARALGIKEWHGRCTPADKAERLDALHQSGSRVLMVGDGLNDAPALAGAHASMSPASAADIAQVSADIVFQGDSLAPVIVAFDLARRSQNLVRQNIALAIGYNVIAVPIAIAGFATPMIAALCMSASSVIVVLNALRLTGGRRQSPKVSGAQTALQGAA